MTARRATTDTRPTYIIRLRAKPRVDAVRALRGALKILGRRFGLQAIEVREDQTTRGADAISRRR